MFWPVMTPATQVLIPGRKRVPAHLTAQQLRTRRLGCKGPNRRQAKVYQATLRQGGEPIAGRRNASLRKIGWSNARHAPLTLVEALRKERRHGLPIGGQRRHIVVALWVRLSLFGLPALQEPRHAIQDGLPGAGC
jgi:hypothetical protein